MTAITTNTAATQGIFVGRLEQNQELLAKLMND